MNYSFYGGRKGSSFTIVKSFPDIKSMTLDFKEGYNASVNFDEFVIIDTISKNDKDNGKVFQRGYNYGDETSILASDSHNYPCYGAIYVGQIVGPTGQATQTHIDDFEKVTKNVLDAEDIVPYVPKPVQDKYDIYKDMGRNTPSLGNSGLVPGKTLEGDFNDSIRWAYYSFRAKDGTESQAYIGFQFPYHVFEWEATHYQTIYNEDGSIHKFTTKELVEKTEGNDDIHPFFSKWHLNIPKGVKGDVARNLRVYQMGVGGPIDEKINYGELENQKQDDINNKRKIIIYDYAAFDEQQAGVIQSYHYIGDYNVIEKQGIKFAEDGTITIDYTHEDTEIFDKLIKWINEIQLTDTGTLTIKYNNSAPDSEWVNKIKWIKDMAFKEDGSVSVEYNNDSYNNLLVEEWKQLIKWIKDISIDGEGTVTITYNNGAPATELIHAFRKITNTTLEDNGTFTINYNNGDPDVYNKKIQWIKDTTLADDGTLTMNFNTDRKETCEHKIQWIKDILLNTSTGNFKVQYNTDLEKDFGRVMQWIKSITLDGEGTITVNYINDATPTVFSKALTWVTTVSLTPQGHFEMTFNNDSISSVTEDIIWIADISFKDNGDFLLTFNNGKTIAQHIKWVKEVTFDNAGSFDMGFNDDTPHVIQKIKWLKNITLDSRDDEENPGTQQIHAIYNDGVDEIIGQPLNYIMRTVVRPEDYHLLVLYSDPLKREKFGTVEYEGKKWADLGVVKSPNGILVGQNYPKAKFPSQTIPAIIEELNNLHPHGLLNTSTTEELKGKVITVGDAEEEKLFFAFDYVTNNWIFLGSLSSDNILPGVISGKINDPTVITISEKLPTGSLWFVTEDL